MIIITEVKYQEVDANERWRIHHMNQTDDNYLMRDPELRIEQMEVETEEVQGRQFQRPGMPRLSLGISKQARGLLKLEYDYVNSLERDKLGYESELKITQNLLNGVDKELKRIESSGFWTRLKWLFKGVNNG